MIRGRIEADANGRPAPAPLGTGLTAVSATPPLVLSLVGSVLTGSIDTGALPTRVKVEKDGVVVGTRNAMNLIEGANVALTVTDNPGADRVDVTVASTGLAQASHTHAESDITGLTTDLAGKLTNSMSTGKLLGRGTGGTGVIEEITLGTNLSLSGTTLNASVPGGGGAPADADYLVCTANTGLSAERVITDTASVVWDKATAGQAKANVQFGSGATVACVGNDARLSDARTPTAHKTSHATGGGDALTAADIGAAASSHTQAVTTVTFSATDKLAGRSSAGSGAGEEITCTAAGRALLDDASAADQRTTLGLGTAATQSVEAIRQITQNAKTADYTLIVGDAGKHISTTHATQTNGITVPASVFSAGDAITIYNDNSTNLTITQGASVTMYLGGTATTGNRTLAQRGIATVLCVASNTFVISGAGLT